MTKTIARSPGEEIFHELISNIRSSNNFLETGEFSRPSPIYRGGNASSLPSPKEFEQVMWWLQKKGPPNDRKHEGFEVPVWQFIGNDYFRSLDANGLFLVARYLEEAPANMQAALAKKLNAAIVDPTRQQSDAAGNDIGVTVLNTLVRHMNAFDPDQRDAIVASSQRALTSLLDSGRLNLESGSMGEYLQHQLGTVWSPAGITAGQAHRGERGFVAN